VVTLHSGLQYKVLVKGEGEVPKKTDKVQVHYEGRLVDGTVFDASNKHGDKPMEFRPDQVIKGWTEALTMMPVGSKWQLYIPYNLAYGNRDSGTIKPYSALIFDVELVGIVK
jgi:FKBP-type peptidyl-prolyl cis-trans isomerase FklB